MMEKFLELMHAVDKATCAFLEERTSAAVYEAIRNELIDYVRSYIEPAQYLPFDVAAARNGAALEAYSFVKKEWAPVTFVGVTQCGDVMVETRSCDVLRLRSLDQLRIVALAPQYVAMYVNQYDGNDNDGICGVMYADKQTAKINAGSAATAIAVPVKVLVAP